eukprot:364939_1
MSTATLSELSLSSTLTVYCLAYNPITDQFQDKTIIEIFEKDTDNIRESFGRQLAKTVTGKERVKFQYGDRDLLMAIARDGRVVMIECYDTRDIIRDYLIQPGDIIYYVPNIEKHMQYHDLRNLRTKFTNVLTKIVSTMDIKYNTLLNSASNVPYDGSTTVDICTTLGVFRQTLSGLCKIDATQCTVRKNYGDIQLKDDDKTLQEHGINKVGHVYIEQGVPLKVNQNIIRIFVQNELKDRCLVWGYVRDIFGDECNINLIPETVLNICFEMMYEETNLPLIYIGDIVLENEWSMYRVKKEISARFSGQIPLVKYMRIREFVNNRLTHVYYDERTFAENAGGSLQDYKEIVCQRCMRQEVITKQHVLVHVVFFDGTQCGKMYDMAFLKTCSIRSEFKKVLSEISGIQQDKIQVRKVWPHVYKDQITRWNCQDFKRNWWEDKMLRDLRSGDIVLYKKTYQNQQSLVKEEPFNDQPPPLQQVNNANNSHNKWQ